MLLMILFLLLLLRIRLPLFAIFGFFLAPNVVVAFSFIPI
jgi:hypothetical protein